MALYWVTDGFFFLAVAEKTESTYLDGEYVGSAVGCINANDEIIFKETLLCPEKPEGLWYETATEKFYIVTDADDSKQTSKLYVSIAPRIDFN